MKKFIVLFVVSMFVFPLIVTGEDLTTLTDPITTINCDPVIDTGMDYVIDIKGYGNQFADYSTGCLNIDSTTYSTSYGTSVDWTGFSNVVGDSTCVEPCDGPGCGMTLTQGSYTTTDFSSNTTTIMSGVNLIGAADMTTFGGLATCVSFSDAVTLPDFSGTLDQTQTVSNFTSGPICGDVWGTASYNGTQSLVLTIGN